MSSIRFLHMDSLRLGSALVGLSDSPEWLRRISTSAVRQSVKNLFEAAIAARCQFVLIAGRLCEQDQDLELAVTWLKSQVATLKEHGIRLVVVRHSDAEDAQLQRLDATILTPDQCLDVLPASLGAVDYKVSHRSAMGRQDAIRIEVGTSVRPASSLAYSAVPSNQVSGVFASNDGAVTAHDGYLRLSAGCPQAIQPTERGVYGGLLIEADSLRRSMTARFCPGDVIRFAQEAVTCRMGSTIPQLMETLRERSRTLGGQRCTVVVDWMVDGHFALTLADAHAFSEMELLKELRSSLHAGHSGAWPCRIRFSDDSTVEVGGLQSTLISEFATLVRERSGRMGANATDWPAVISMPLNAGAETPVAVRVLRRFAG